MKTILLASLLCLSTVTASPVALSQTTATAMTRARGTFDVTTTPATHAPDDSISSATLDKVYHGELEAIGKGEILSAGDPASGNAGYVAMERVTGKLAGPSGIKTGSFALMQMGQMSTGTTPQLTAVIVPGSGTGELSGIYGSMTIDLASGKHSYVVDYAFSTK